MVVDFEKVAADFKENKVCQAQQTLLTWITFMHVMGKSRSAYVFGLISF